MAKSPGVGAALRARETQRRAGVRLLGLDLAIARRRRRHERIDQAARGVRHFGDGTAEGFLVGLRRAVILS
jgi:hypothetical protein